MIDQVEHRYADSNGVKIHYAIAGKGPLVVMIHGFPDFWYSWRHQMEGLMDHFRVAAMDLRGYNESDKPKGVDRYDMKLLVGDVVAVVKDLGGDGAVVVGHDWGGAMAWRFAMDLPEMTHRLIVLNLPHPKGFLRELADNAEQRANTQYARDFQKPEAHKLLNAEGLAAIVARDDESLRVKYVDAFNNSDFEAMLNYYRRNYPREPYQKITEGLPKVGCPVLQFHGLEDWALHHHGLNNTWEWLESDYTLVTVPNAGHWVHHDAADLVTSTIRWWLLDRR